MVAEKHAEIWIFLNVMHENILKLKQAYTVCQYLLSLFQEA